MTRYISHQIQNCLRTLPRYSFILNINLLLKHLFDEYHMTWRGQRGVDWTEKGLAGYLFYKILIDNNGDATFDNIILQLSCLLPWTLVLHDVNRNQLIWCNIFISPTRMERHIQMRSRDWKKCSAKLRYVDNVCDKDI